MIFSIVMLCIGAVYLIISKTLDSVWDVLYSYNVYTRAFALIDSLNYGYFFEDKTPSANIYFDAYGSCSKIIEITKFCWDGKEGSPIYYSTIYLVPNYYSYNGGDRLERQYDKDENNKENGGTFYISYEPSSVF